MPKLQYSKQNGYFIHIPDAHIRHVQWKKGDNIDISANNRSLGLKKLRGDAV